MKKLTFSILACVLTLSLHAQIQALKPDVWLRADQFNFQKGVWADMSENHRDALLLSGKGVVADSLMNGNPAVWLDGLQFQIVCKGVKHQPFTVMTVFQPAGSEEQGIWQIGMGDNFRAALTTRRSVNPQTIVRYASGNIANSQLSQSVQMQNFTGEIENDTILLGKVPFYADSVASFTGKIAECFVFFRILEKKEKQMLQSYLAIKYGITLQYCDYSDSKNNLLRSYTDNATTPYNVAGIGRDDANGLYQKQSFSNEDNLHLTVSAGKMAASNNKNSATLENNNFLMWSCNNDALTFTAEEIKKDLKLLNRKWTMIATGKSSVVLPTGLSINTNQLGMVAGKPLYLVIDQNGSGIFNGSKSIVCDSISKSGIAWFSNVVWDCTGSGKRLFSFGANTLDLPPVSKKMNVPILNDATPAEPLYTYRLYPNPTDGAYTIVVSLSEATDVLVRINDMTGKLLKEHCSNHSASYTFDGFIYIKGMYLVNVYTKFGRETFKLIVK
jgi:hypothetical protein